LGDNFGVGALVEYRLVLAEAAVTVADLFGEGRLPGLPSVARPDMALTESEVVDFLHNGNNLQVATIGRDVVVDGLIAFRSFRKSQRVANLRRDPRLTVLLEDGDSVIDLRGVMIQGRARLVDDRDLVLRLYGEVTEKYEGCGWSQRDGTRFLVCGRTRTSRSWSSRIGLLPGITPNGSAREGFLS
jgi:hypothetical protein